MCRPEFGNPVTCRDEIGWQGVRVQMGQERRNAGLACVSWGSSQASENSFWCDASGDTCTKVTVGRVPQMTARAGMLMMKRLKCTHKESRNKKKLFITRTKCDVFKKGMCLNIPVGSIPGFVARGATGEEVNARGCVAGHYKETSVIGLLWIGGGQNDLPRYTVDTCAQFCDSKSDCTHFMVSKEGRCKLLSTDCSKYASTDQGWKVYKKVPLRAAGSDPQVGPCRDECAPGGGMKQTQACTSGYCHQYKSGGRFHSRCAPGNSGHKWALSECKATCGQCEEKEKEKEKEEDKVKRWRRKNSAMCAGTGGGGSSSPLPSLLASSLSSLSLLLSAHSDSRLRVHSCPCLHT